MTLKYNQNHWKWYEWVKLNEYYFYHIDSTQENHNIKVFATYGQLADQLASFALIVK